MVCRAIPLRTAIALPRVLSHTTTACRRSTTMVARTAPVKLLVVGGKGTPELAVLKGLPDSVHVVGIGRSLDEFSSVSEEDWAGVEVVLNCGVQKNAATKDSIKEFFPKLTNLKWFHSVSAGVEHLLFPALVDSNVTLTNAKGVYSHSLAEYALTACNWFAKDLPRLRASQKAQKWAPFDVEELRGKTMGVVGLGDIGFATATLAKAFKMKVVGLRRNTEIAESEKHVVERIYAPSELNALMAESDYVVAALPFTPDTSKFITREAIKSMKPNGVFVNVGRGKTVDEEALIEALQQGAIKGAGLDVFATEPLPADSPLYSLDNVLMSPHCADRTTTFQHESVERFVELVAKYVETGELSNVVDKNSGY